MAAALLVCAPATVPSPSNAAPVALVTGAAIRVGRAIASELVRVGYRVWVHHHRSQDEAEALVAELRATHGADAVVDRIAADLGDPEARAALCRAVLDRDAPAQGRLDLLVNNAASFERGAFLERDDEDLERVLAINLVAPLSLVRALAGALASTGGSVVNIVDVAGLHPLRNYLDHCVAKAGLEMATRALAVELAPVRVNAVAPGTVAWPTDPRYGEGSAARAAILEQIPLGRIGEPRDVAEAVAYLARARHVSGQCLAVDGGRLAAVAADRG